MKLAALSLLIASNIALADVVDVEYPQGMNSMEVASRLLTIDAETVQIFRVTPNQASELCTTLESGYDNFLYLPSGNLFIASKSDFEVLLARNSNQGNGSGSSLQGGTKASWGKKGVEFEVYVSGEAHDKKGNYVEAEVSQNSDGTGAADVHGGSKDEKR